MPPANKDPYSDILNKSEFNESIAKLMRIDSLRKSCHNARLMGKQGYPLWLESLRGLHSEASEMMKDEEHTKCLNWGKKLSVLINDILTKRNPNLVSIFSNEAFDFEIYLSKILHDRGIGFKMKDDIGDGL